MAKRILCLLALLIASALSGCAGQANGPATGGPSSPEGTLGTEGTQATPTVFDWSGHVVASEAELATHYRPTEDALWPVFQEGILFSVDEIPQAMEVSLDWEGLGDFLIMLHSHKGHGTNVYVEHITEMDGVDPKCLRVPAADLTEGVWQVMVHSQGAMQADFTLHIGLLGGAGHIVEGERHGHWLQDGDFEVDQHDIEPCQLIQAPAKGAAIPTVLPPESHFEFGESLGCNGSGAAGSASAGPACIEFQAGPGGTGRSVDGHWIQLGQPYWGLLVTTTIDQGGIGNDSDCVFIDAAIGIIGEAHNLDQPCTGLVPEGAEWVFLYPYIEPALGMTMDFVLPPA